MNKPFCGERWEFSIAAYNEVGLGPFSEPKPGQCGHNKIQIRNFVVAEVARSWARLEWDLPILSNIITEMWIYVSIGPQTNKPIQISPTSNRYIIPELRPASNVTVSLKALTNTFDTKSEVLTFFTNRSPVLNLQSGSVKVREHYDNGTALLYLPRLLSDIPQNQIPENIALVVAYESKSPDTYPQMELERLYAISSTKKPEVKPYIAAKWRQTSYLGGEFILGDAKQYMQYVNLPLKSGFAYYLFLRFEYSTSNPSNHSSTSLSEVINMKSSALTSAEEITDDPIQIIIISSVLGSVFLVGLFIALMRRKVTAKGDKEFASGIKRAQEIRADEKPLLDTSVPVSIKGSQATQLAERLERLRADGGLLLHSEWSEIDTAGSKKYTNDVQLENRPKCRYGDLICPDESRVALSSGQFIHANWIPMYGDLKAIATQGPMPETIGDFWEMVWENNVKYIVMLCD